MDHASKHGFALLFLYSYYKFGPHTRLAEAISVSAAKLIKLMFPLHDLSSTCKYFCFLDASSLSELGFTVTSNSSGALDEEEGIVMKGSLEGFVGDFVEENLRKEKENKNENENKNELFLWHSWLAFCPGWPPPRAVFIVGHNSGNHVGWIDTSFYTPFGHAPSGFPRGPGVNCDFEFHPAVVICEGCFHFMIFCRDFDSFQLRTQGSQWAPWFPRGSSKSRKHTWCSPGIFVLPWRSKVDF